MNQLSVRIHSILYLEMRLHHLIFVLFVWLYGLPVDAQNAQTISIINNYKDWGWDSVFVARNKFISVAVVPKAAGRILEYDLGETPSLWLNSRLLGKSYKPTDQVKKNEWRNFGGYRLVPLPIDNCAEDLDGIKMKRWPPPAIIGDSPYKADIKKNAEGYQTINVTSGIQDLPVPIYDEKTHRFSHPDKIDESLGYKRSLYIRESSSLVFIKHSLINKGVKTVMRGIMTTSQHVSRSKPDLEDGENFLVFIPFDKKEKLPDGKQFEITTTPEMRWNYINKNRIPLDKTDPEMVAKYFNQGTNWIGEVAPGIFELHYDYYLMSGFHIIAAKPWLCYVNKTKMTAFVKLFEPFNKKLEYEYGINVSVFCSGMETGYIETEVRTPLHKLEPGQSLNYHEIHGAARIANLPVLDVNQAGVITKRLNFDKVTKMINGQYGVFWEGKAILRLVDETGNTKKEIDLGEITPLEAFAFDHLITDKGVQLAQVVIRDVDNKIHELDSYSFDRNIQ